MVHLLTLTLALSGSIDPVACRQSGSVTARWAGDGHGGISFSADAPASGEVTLRCRVPVPSGATAVTVAFNRALVSFQPAGSKAAGSGLLLNIGRACRAELIRVAGEDWIEARHRAWSLEVPAGARRIDITLTARDASKQDPIRIDLEGLRISPGQAHNAEICQPVQHELHRDGGQNQTH